ncbi:MAG: class I SAM-dependent methyltransferase [Acidimicrobiales bacterium]
MTATLQSGGRMTDMMSDVLHRLRRRSPIKRAHVRRVAEILGSPLLLAALAFTKLYRRSFHETSPVLYAVSDRVGVYPIIDHYHEPLAIPSRHLTAAPGERRHLPAIDLQVDAQLHLLGQFSFQDELRAIRRSSDGTLAPFYDNLAFSPGDAATLHNVIRHFQPGSVVEIGSGHSTRFCMHALRLNAAHGGLPGQLTCIEPFESPWLEDMGVDVLRAEVQDVDPDVFSRLGPGDVLFVDSSHVVRPQGDVVHIFNEIIPALAPGVLVHVHDIFTPRDYPEEWLRRRWLWSEQYLLEALLSNNRRLGVLLSVNLLAVDYRPQFAASCPVLDDRLPASFWMTTRD